MQSSPNIWVFLARDQVLSYTGNLLMKDSKGKFLVVLPSKQKERAVIQHTATNGILLILQMIALFHPKYCYSCRQILCYLEK